MKHVNLNSTDLVVSDVCLGTGKFGNSLDVTSSKHQLSHFFYSGYNFIDTARVYGNSERVIGEWLKETNLRSSIVIASKGAHPDVEWNSRMTREDILYDIETSLTTLGTDYIDLYFLHRDDRNVPVREIIDMLEDLCNSGKVRYYGCSNWTLDRIIEAQQFAKKSGSKGFVCNQVMLSLTKANKNVFDKMDMIQADKDMVEYHENTNLTLMSYMTLAGGYFIKLMEKSEIHENYKIMYDNEENRKTLIVMKDLCKKYGYSPLELLLQYVLARPFCSIPVISFSSIGQMDEVLRFSESSFQKEHIDMLVKIF